PAAALPSWRPRWAACPSPSPPRPPRRPESSMCTTDTLGRRIPALALLLALAACGGGRSEPARVATAAAVLEARVSPSSLRVGENRLDIELRTPGGDPIADAQVTAKVFMHAMGAMPAMGGPARVEPVGPGRWRADFALEMGGTWQVEITAHR